METEVPTEVEESSVCFACNSQVAPQELQEDVDEWIQCDRYEVPIIMIIMIVMNWNFQSQ